MKTALACWIEGCCGGGITVIEQFDAATSRRETGHQSAGKTSPILSKAWRQCLSRGNSLASRLRQPTSITTLETKLSLCLTLEALSAGHVLSPPPPRHSPRGARNCAGGVGGARDCVSVISYCLILDCVSSQPLEPSTGALRQDGRDVVCRQRYCSPPVLACMQSMLQPPIVCVRRGLAECPARGLADCPDLADCLLLHVPPHAQPWTQLSQWL